MSSFILRTGRLCNWNINSNMEACFNPRKFPFFGIECFESSSNFPNFQLQATNPESQFKKLRLGVALFVSWHEMNYGTRKLIFKKCACGFFLAQGISGENPFFVLLLVVCCQVSSKNSCPFINYSNSQLSWLPPSAVTVNSCRLLTLGCGSCWWCPLRHSSKWRSCCGPEQKVCWYSIHLISAVPKRSNDKVMLSSISLDKAVPFGSS